MKYVVIIGGLLILLSLCCTAHAQQGIDFICKNDCISRGGTLGYCNNLCSTSDTSKSSDCMSNCQKQNKSYYSCSKECAGTGGAEESPATAPNMGVRPPS